VSGGGDSLALALMLAGWAKANGLAPPVALIVDHRLRKGSAKDADTAARWLRASLMPAHVLTWTGKKPASDIEAEARAARYRLMGTWCKGRGVKFLYVAHTLEDQAETFLLRLARGSGLDGLSAMRARAPYPLPGFDGVELVRPLLGHSRASLRAYLTARKQDWLEDPMNNDPRFARVKIRAAMPALMELGLTAPRLASAAAHLARARRALDDEMLGWLKNASQIEERRAVLDGRALAALPEEIGLRVLAHVLGRVSGQTYRPRFERLERLYAGICAGLSSACTLHGCRIGKAPKREAIFGPGTLTIVREAKRGGT
jgi:tRNA(Ile)-lysidine synthase